MAIFGNDPNTRILVVTPRPRDAQNYVNMTLKNNVTTNKMSFIILDMLEDNLSTKDGFINESDQDTFVHKMMKSNPTAIIMAYEHHVGYGDNLPNAHYYKFPPANSLPWVLKIKKIMESVLNCCNENTLTISISYLDKYRLEQKIVLTCRGPATEEGTNTFIDDVVDKNQIPNLASSKILLLSGTHGSQENKEGKIRPVGGFSGFSKMGKLDYQFYLREAVQIHKSVFVGKF